jgi:hypothetical protein
MDDHLSIALDPDPFGDQAFLDHLLERIALDVFCVTAS